MSQDTSMYRNHDSSTISCLINGLIVQKHFMHFDLIANCGKRENQNW